MKSVRSKPRKTNKTSPKRISRTRKPANLTLEEWQIALRREFGREQKFQFKNIGDGQIFSDYRVTNPATGGVYRVAIRGKNPGDNYCSCPDFAVNTLGVCKHIEFTLAKLERKRGGKKALENGFHPPYTEVYLRYGAKREVCLRLGTECPAAFAKFATNFFDDRGVLKADAHREFHTFLKRARNERHEIRCYDDTIQFIAEKREAERRRERIDELFPKGAADRKFETLLKVKLYPYQRQGTLFAARAGRSIIADDMGLGKTIQAIAATEILAQSSGAGRALVIAPTAVKHQWKQEIERFTSRTAEVIDGLRTRRKELYQTDTFYKITNYDVIHQDTDRIREWAPDVIIMDEAQRIKNWKTRRAQVVKRLSSPYTIVLTGTPLENRLEELHSIVEFVDRYRLGPLFRFLAEHQTTDEAGQTIGYRNLTAVAKTLEPILIRRTKNEVLHELPERVDRHLFLPMTDEQWKHHHEYKDVVARIVAKWRRIGFLSEVDQQILRIALQNMRMVCNSTYLLDKNTDFGVKADEARQLLDEILEEPETKAVVFSQWIGTHQLLMDRLESRRDSIAFYHGTLRVKERNELLQRFRKDPECRVFLSTDAGGVGLNLQHASVVLMMDQPWNPAVLEQRIGRVHRLGQKQNVRVIHFVSEGTIEHGMLDVLRFKKALFAGVLDGGEDTVFLGGSRLKKFMETVEKVTDSIPAVAPSPAPAQDLDLGSMDIEPILETEQPVAVSDNGSRIWNELLSSGAEFLEKLGRAFTESTSETASPRPGDFLNRITARDERTGENYLRIPVPEPETIQKIVQVLGMFADALKK